MANMSASIALNRFGLGARRDEPLQGDPKSWLRNQLKAYEAHPAALAAAPARIVVAEQLADYLAEARATGQQRRRQKQEPEMAPAAMGATATGDAAMAENNPELPESARRVIRKAGREYYLSCVAARTNAALVTPAAFVERLVHFWANHFAVSADKLPIIGMSGLLEFEAIRPHVLGRFADMLVAVEQHPAMLLYLDQAQSIGPDSMIGTRIAARSAKAPGLNENLAREILELHTLGARTGYSQTDVIEFARALTGWTVNGLTRGPAARAVGNSGAPGSFHFAERIHQPGARNILGKNYGEGGESQARAVLSDLAAHPSTARHIATKLARHFAGDEPPPALVDRLSAAYRQSGGDLTALYRVLIDAPEIWSAAAPKFKTPWEWSISALRGLGTRQIEGQAAAGLLQQLGQPVWRPGSPAGYDDIAASWAGPDALIRRVEAAERLASRAQGLLDARELAPKLLPGNVSASTAQAISRAESPGQGLALLLVAPEFLRR